MGVFHVLIVHVEKYYFVDFQRCFSVYCLHLLSIVESLEVNLKTVSIQTQHITFRLPRSCCELFVRRSRHWRLTVRRWSSN